ncbi:hypothetical protein [Gottfriedia acidiceleris]|uniref:hypothetical protein n=1 Tax=Gottfriedia acidiceleris TaxID=371036 RepID=UPI002FFDC96F
MKVSKIILNLLLTCIIFMNFTFINLNDFKIGIPHILLLLVLTITLLSIERFNKKTILILILILFFPCLKLFTVFNQIEFFKTYFFFILGLLSYVYVTKYLKLKTIDNIQIFNSRLIVFIFITSIFGVIQFIFANYFDSMVLYNFLLDYQFHGPQLIGTYKEYVRANSIYSEPSIFGIMCNFSTALILASEQKIKNGYLYLVFNFIGLIISFSSSALFFFFIIVGIYLLKFKRRTFILTALGILIICISFTDILSIFRFSEFSSVGTSGYYRVIAPFLLLKQVLLTSPFLGIGLGQVDIYVPQFDFMQNGTSTGKTLDNNFTLLFVVFGLPAIGIFIYFIKKYFYFILSNKKNIIIVVFIISFFISTGLFFSPEFVIIIIWCEWFMNYNSKKSDGDYFD